MICPTCGCSSHVLETRAGVHHTMRRRRVCQAGHRFWSVEMHTSAASLGTVKRSARGVDRRIATLRRDIDIAQNLHQNGGRKSLLSARHGLDPSAVYRAARRGRAHLQRLARGEGGR